MSDATPTEAGQDIPERFLPDEMKGELVAAEHIARYTWASSLCDGRRVLDAGCGAGYGSALLAGGGATEVVAIDRADAALELARAVVPANVSCEQGDVTDLPHPDHSFDVVVCFEVIEHVADQAKALDEFARVLRPDGLLIVSSPNRDRYVPGNPHHVHELVRDEMQALLDARFAQARIYAQHVMLASVVAGADAEELVDPTTARSAPPDPADEMYLIAVAGRQLPAAPAPVVTLAQFAEPRAWLSHIDDQRRRTDYLEEQLGAMEVHEAERAQALDQLVEAQSRLARLTAIEAEVVQLRDELERTQTQLATTSAELGARSAELETSAAELHAKSAELAGVRAALDTIVSSKSWALTRPLRTVAQRGR